MTAGITRMPAGPRHENFIEAAFAADNVLDIELGLQAEGNIDIGEPEVRVKEQYFLPRLRQADGEVDRDIGLAHTALAAGHRNDVDRGCLTHAYILNRWRAAPLRLPRAACNAPACAL
jgi:hypothetical protein